MHRVACLSSGAVRSPTLDRRQRIGHPKGGSFRAAEGRAGGLSRSGRPCDALATRRDATERNEGLGYPLDRSMEPHRHKAALGSAARACRPPFSAKRNKKGPEPARSLWRSRSRLIVSRLTQFPIQVKPAADSRTDGRRRTGTSSPFRTTHRVSVWDRSWRFRLPSACPE